MILTDREIQIAIAQKQIILEPRPDPSMLSSTSIDLRLAPVVRVWKEAGANNFVLTPADPQYRFPDLIETTTEQVDITSGFELRPGQFILAWTMEVLTLPTTSRVAARVEGRSSMARLGIGVHVTAPTIHAGFQGSIQLEIKNHGPFRVSLMPGMKICQLIFELTLGTPEKGYAGQFRGQSAV